MSRAETSTGERRAAIRLTPWRVSRLVFLLAIALIVLSSASLIYIGQIASREADAQALKNETRLFDNALRDRQVLIAREQLSVARWTKSYENITLHFDEDYVREDVAETLGHDFAHDRVYLVEKGERVLMVARRGEPEFSPRTLVKDDPLRVIARRAIDRFMRDRIAIPGGFAQKPISALKADGVSEFAFAVIEGEPSMLSAMAIVPDDEEAMRDGPPVILVSAKFLRGDFSRDLNAQLAFHELTFAPATSGRRAGYRTVTGMGGETLGAFQWVGEQPGAQLWKVVIPAIVVLALALAFSAMLIARIIVQIARRLEDSEAKNRKLALHDSLTGLANRLQLRQALDAAVEALPDSRFAVMACDLDRFKAVNDTFGHAGGDTLIREVAARLTLAVGNAGLVCRTGGDEFIILLTGYIEAARLASLAREVIASVCRPVPLDGASASVGISVGVAIAPERGGSADAIVAAADGALYVAKERGKGIVVFAQEIAMAGVDEAAPKMAPDAA